MKRCEPLLEKALWNRTALLAQPKNDGTNAYRLFCGSREGIPGLVIEVFDSTAIIQEHVGKWEGTEANLKEVADWCLGKIGVRSVYRKKFIPDRSRTAQDVSLKNPTPFAGEPAAEWVAIKENGYSLWMRPYDGYATGIFLDQRNNRAYLGKQSQGKKVLNAFSYTCGFSVAAAIGGATVTSVDLSKRYLEWGKKNFELNQLEIPAHSFIEADIFEFFKRASKRKERFDLIILDPPSFSRGAKGKPFSVARDLNRLLTETVSLLLPGGKIFFSTNYAQWDGETLMKELGQIEACSTLSEESLPQLPIDFEWEESPLKAILLKS